MSDIDFKLAHCLNAVLGWIELGNISEARAELDSLPPEFSDRVEVLDIQWLLHSSQCDWSAALRVAEQLVTVAPDSCAGWLQRAYALRRVPQGGLEKALEMLQPAVEKFPEEPTVPFNLACYQCQLGNLDQARTWLLEAFKRGKKRKIKAMALADRDLEKLWPEIRRW